MVDLHHERVQLARLSVLALIEAGKHPAREDLDVALEPLPDETIAPELRSLIEYARRAYVRGSAPRTPGALAGRNNAKRNQVIRLYYRSLLAEVRAAEQSRRVKRRVERETARLYGVSVRTVQRAIASPPRKT